MANDICLYFMISIHAPLAGCDIAPAAGKLLGQAFQSTHPLRGATQAGDPLAVLAQFQSTHPLRGATACGAGGGEAQAISIHAPLAGCDPTAWPRPGWISYFNPRTPCGVRRRLRRAYRDLWPISIHAPLAGCDALETNAAAQGDISIHEPLAGCDPPPLRLPLYTANFNPRTPCGVRRDR